MEIGHCVLERWLARCPQPQKSFDCALQQLERQFRSYKYSIYFLNRVPSFVPSP